MLCGMETTARNARSAFKYVPNSIISISIYF